MDQPCVLRRQGAPGGVERGEGSRGVAILVQHPLECTELSGDLAYAYNRGAAVLLWMLMAVFLVHAGRLRASGSFVKNALSDMGYGGISLFL